MVCLVLLIWHTQYTVSPKKIQTLYDLLRTKRTRVSGWSSTLEIKITLPRTGYFDCRLIGNIDKRKETKPGGLQIYY